MSLNLSVAPSDIPGILADMARTNLVPFIKGDPGTSKSASVHQFAEAANLKLVDIRLATCDPTDINNILN